MNILVIGNGFDLAHGLPTKYGDFLEWVNVIKQVVKVKKGETFKDVDWGNVNDKIKELIIDRSMLGNQNVFPYEKICNELLYDNIWIDYFLECNMYQKENWIDFESEISNVIQAIDKDMHGLSKVYKLEDEFERLSNGFLNRKYYESQMTFKDLRDRLLSDLNKLIRAFEIYLCEYVEKIEVERKSSDIESLEEIGYILSFNYTDTWKKLYDVDETLLLEELDKGEFNKVTEGDFTQLFIELLSAYDVVQDEKYYNVAKSISDRLIEIDSDAAYLKINKLQLIKRKRNLTEDEQQELERIESDTDDTKVVCAANILLENRRKAKKKLDEMSDEDKELFMTFPIYNLL